MTDDDQLKRRQARETQRAVSPTRTGGQRRIHAGRAAGLAISRGMALRAFAVDLDALPQTVDLSSPKTLSTLFMWLAGFFFVMTGLPGLIIMGDGARLSGSSW